MLKPASEQAGGPPHPEDERPVGDLVSQLVDDGKAYVHAEVELAKAKARTKADVLKLSAVMFGAALLFGQAAIVVLAVGVAMALAPHVGPLLGGLIAAALFGGIAGALALVGINRIREGL
ncbi:MAG TPA: phage holin family protein [Sphingomicrobium sp.]|nr:phage holin family protein [Sphingomicrobium sp.]